MRGLSRTPAPTAAGGCGAEVMARRNAIAYVCIPNTNTTTTAKPTQTQTIPSPDTDPDSETPSHSKTNPSSQPERKRRGVVESVENCAARLFHGLNASFFTFSTN